MLRRTYACESEDRTQNDNYDDYGDNDLAVEALYMLVRPSVAIADALRYDLVERVLRLTGFVGFNGSVCFERLLIAGLGRVATDDCACSGCVGVDRVGVGWQRSSCLQCHDCLRGNENLCDENQGLIVTGPGGFADYLMVDSRFAFPIPKGIDSNVAGPLLCGGITVYAGLRNAGMSSGQEIGILGIGGLGHMAVQFAKKLGNRVTVFTTSQDKAEFAHKMGADEAIVVGKGEVPQAPSSKLDILLSTVPASLDWVPYIDFLDSNGALAFVGVPDEPLSIPLFSLLVKQRRIVSSLIGGRAMINEMLAIAEKFEIEPIVEVFAIAQANEAMQKVRDNQVRYRAVLTMS